MLDIKRAFRGDAVVRAYSEPTAPGIVGRIQEVIYGQWSATSAVTQTHLDNLNTAQLMFDEIRPHVDVFLKKLHELEMKARKKGVPYTPHRLR